MFIEKLASKTEIMKNIIFLLAFPLALQAQNNYTALLDNFMQAQVSVKEFNGNVMIAKSGNTIYQKSFGYKNYDTRELLDNNSMVTLTFFLERNLSGRLMTIWLFF